MLGTLRGRTEGINVQGVDNQEFREIMEKSGTFLILEKSGNFVNISPNQGTLHFYFLNVTKKSPNRRYQTEEARGEGNETKFKKKKRLKLS